MKTSQEAKAHMDKTTQKGKKPLTGSNTALICGLALLAALACLPGIFRTQSPPPGSTAGLDELHFSDPAAEARFRNLYACINGLRDNRWHADSLRIRGNFLSSRWCQGAGVDQDCQEISTASDRPDLAMIELFTLSYRGPDEAFGLGVHAIKVPQETGWRVSFSYVENGLTITGNGWGLSFHQYRGPSERPGTVVGFGHAFDYMVVETKVIYNPETPILEDIAQYLASPEAMRDRGLEQLRALAGEVREAIEAGEVSGCDYPPYEGNGIPPACTPRPMTPAEQADELDRLEATIEEQESLLMEHYQEMYATWMDAFPFERCWPLIE